MFVGRRAVGDDRPRHVLDNCPAATQWSSAPMNVSKYRHVFLATHAKEPPIGGGELRPALVRPAG